ncbi:MAG: DUF2887 domain-containing protein [Synechococcaceae cyanobacterium ELA263]
MACFDIAESTAREYTRSLLQKFGCRNRTLVLRTALELGLLLPGADGLNSTSSRVQKSWVTFPSGFAPPVHSDHWYFAVFQAEPDLIRLLLPHGPDLQDLSQADQAGQPQRYRFVAEEVKSVRHQLDGVLWPRDDERGSPERPVVILEVQMHPDRGFQRRLGAESFRFLQQHPRVRHLQVVVLVPHRRLALGNEQPLLLQRFLAQDVIWVDLAELSQVEEPDLRLALLTLPVRPEADLVPCCRRILALRPELLELILPMLGERFAGLTSEEIMATIGISRDSWRHSRAFQEILQEGLQEGIQEGRQKGLQEGRLREAAALSLRLLQRRFGPLDSTTTARIEALVLDQLEDLSLSLLDFSTAADLQHWLERQKA